MPYTASTPKKVPKGYLINHSAPQYARNQPHRSFFIQISLIRLLVRVEQPHFRLEGQKHSPRLQYIRHALEEGREVCDALNDRPSVNDIELTEVAELGVCVSLNETAVIRGRTKDTGALN